MRQDALKAAGVAAELIGAGTAKATARDDVPPLKEFSKITTKPKEERRDRVCI